MRRTILVSSLAVLVAVGLIGGAVYAVRAHQRDRARELLEVSTSSFATCLLGDVHPAAGTTDATLRGIRLAEGAPVPAVDGDAGAPTLGPDGGELGEWPARCLPYAEPLRASYERAFAAGAAERWVGLDGVRAELAAGSTQHLAEVLDALMPFWVSAAAPSVPRPVTPLVALLRTSASKPMLDDATNVTVSAVEQVQSELHLTLGPAVIGCVVEGSTMHLTCVRPSFAVDQALSHPKGAPLLFEWNALGERPSAVVDGRDGSKVLLKLPSYWQGYAFANGRITVLTQPIDEADDGTYVSHIYERTPTGQTLHGPSSVPLGATPRNAGGWLLWKEVSEVDPEGDAHIRARDLSAGALGGVITVGTVSRRPSGTGHSSGSCESTHLFFDMSPVLAIRAPSGKWTVVAQEARPDDAVRTLSCEGDTARIVDAKTTEVRVQECTPAKCVSKSVTLVLPQRASVAALGQDDVLVTWPSGRALYARRGKLDDLATAKPFVLIEDDEKPAFLAPVGMKLGGPREDDDAASLTALPGQGYVVFVQFGSKTYGVALKKDGTASVLVDAK